MNLTYDMIIVGGGMAAGYACHTIVNEKKELGEKLSVLMITNEILPYEKSDIIPSFLCNGKEKVADIQELYTCRGSNFETQDQSWYDENDIAIEYANVEQINFESKQVILSSGKELNYAKFLFISTGVAAKKLLNDKNEVLHEDICYIDNFEAISKLSDTLIRKPNLKVAIIGGGILGIEISAALRALGADVTLVHHKPHVLNKLVNREISEWYTVVLEKQGINVITSDKVIEIQSGENANDYNVTLDSGLSLKVDLVVSCIGCKPNTSFLPLENSITCTHEHYIVVDQFYRSSDPSVYAIGDVATQQVKSNSNDDDTYIVCPHSDHARKSARIAVKHAFNRDSSIDTTFVPLIYSRIPLLDDQLIVMEFYGTKKESSIAIPFGNKDEEAFGVYWLNPIEPIISEDMSIDGKNDETFFQLVGALLVNGVASEFEAIATAVQLQPKISVSEMNELDLRFAFTCLENFTDINNQLLSTDQDSEHKKPELLVNIDGRIVDVIASLKHLFNIHAKACTKKSIDPDKIPKTALNALCNDLDLELSEQELYEAELAFEGEQISYDDFERWWLG